MADVAAVDAADQRAAVAEAGLTEVVVTGSRPDLLAVVQRSWRPGAVVAWGEPYASPLWEGRDGPGQEGQGLVCRNYTCLAPVRDPEALARALAS